MRWEAILLAGGTLEKDFAEYGEFPSKAYLPIHGKRMADYVLDVLESVSEITRIISVVPKHAPAFLGTVGVVGGKSILESMTAGIEAILPETEMALFVTCDLPCLTAAGVKDFINQSEHANAGLCYSYASKSDSELQFPGIHHTYVRMREGTICGGGLIGVAPKNFPSLARFADRATKCRKNVFAIVGILGIPMIAKLLFRRLSIRDGERRASELLGFPAKGIFSRYPEIAFNVDDARSLSLAQKFLRKDSF